jgi:hypothetical protein
MTAEEGVDYYELVGSVPSDEKGIMNVQYSDLKKGTYLLIQAKEANFISFDIIYTK